MPMSSGRNPCKPPGGFPKKSSTARRLASLHGFYDYLVNQVNRLSEDPTAAIRPPKQDKVLPKYLTAEQSISLLESTQTQSDFPERDYCMEIGRAHV